MSSTDDRRGWRQLVQAGTLLVVVSLLTIGWKSYSNAADAGPKGQFGYNGPATLKYLRGLDFTIASTGDSIVVKQYVCTVAPTPPAPPCPAAGVRLMIIPETSSHQRDWESAMRVNHAGHVVAMVVNVDGVAFPDLGLQPGERAYAWVGQIGPNATDRGFAIYRLNSNGVTTNTWFSATDVKHCDNDEVRSKPSVKTAHPTPAGSSPCVAIPVGTAALAVLASRTTSIPSTTAAFGPGQLWISCSGGCCEVTGR